MEYLKNKTTQNCCVGTGFAVDVAVDGRRSPRRLAAHGTRPQRRDVGGRLAAPAATRQTQFIGALSSRFPFQLDSYRSYR